MVPLDSVKIQFKNKFDALPRFHLSFHTPYPTSCHPTRLPSYTRTSDPLKCISLKPHPSLILRHPLRQNRRIRQPPRTKRPLLHRRQKIRKIPHHLIRHILQLRNQNQSPLSRTRLFPYHIPHLRTGTPAAVHRLR